MAAIASPAGSRSIAPAGTEFGRKKEPHPEGAGSLADGPTVFAQACKIGLKGVVLAAHRDWLESSRRAI
jgi:hypothetical protein